MDKFKLIGYFSHKHDGYLNYLLNMDKYKLAKRFNQDGDHHIRTAIRKIYNSLYWVKFGKMRKFSDDEILNEFSDIKGYLTAAFVKRFID